VAVRPCATTSGDLTRHAGSEEKAAFHPMAHMPECAFVGQQAAIRFMRPARAVIDLDALRHNYRVAKQRHGSRVLAVIKANAYGHGAVACARALSAEADGFAVAFTEEALELRAAGITAPILLLEGAFDSEDLQHAAAQNLWITVHHPEQLRMIETTGGLREPLTAWLKINSGMNRVGFNGDQAACAWQRLRDSGRIRDIVLMTHLARADETDSDATPIQIERFDSATGPLSGARSLANSAGILDWPASHRDWGRAGILLYGADPSAAREDRLKAVMRLESAVMATREIAAGEPLGYGARFHAERPLRVGVVALGYADGYPRCLGDGTPVIVDGSPSRLIGRVSMDMLTVDLTSLPQAGIGSKVEFWGAALPVNRIALTADTIAYELLCHVKRVRFDYHGEK